MQLHSPILFFTSSASTSSTASGPPRRTSKFHLHRCRRSTAMPFPFLFSPSGEVRLDFSFCVHAAGKGRKSRTKSGMRCVPLRKTKYFTRQGGLGCLISYTSMSEPSLRSGQKQLPKIQDIYAVQSVAHTNAFTPHHRKGTTSFLSGSRTSLSHHRGVHLIPVPWAPTQEENIKP